MQNRILKTNEKECPIGCCIDMDLDMLHIVDLQKKSILNNNNNPKSR